MGEWVLFLGAGASVAAPTCMPDFASLARGVLGGIGWRYRSGYWHKHGFPAFADPGRAVSPEVLFGTLQGFGVGYAEAVASLLGTDSPNAAHRVAAAVLAAIGTAKQVRVTLAGPGIKATTASCSWDSSVAEFACTIADPHGIRKGKSHCYTITAAEKAGRDFGTATPLSKAANPETIRFR